MVEFANNLVMKITKSGHHSQGFSLTAAERRKRFVQRQKYQSEFKEVLEKDDSSFEDEQKNIYSVEDIEVDSRFAAFFENLAVNYFAAFSVLHCEVKFSNG